MAKPSPAAYVMIQAARAAGKGLARDFGEVENLQVSKKGPADFVSTADHRAEKVIFESLSKARPGYGFLMEETGAVEGTDKTHRFIIDPLDGTLNFLHGIPHFSVSIGLERDGRMVAGVVLDVAKGDLYWAETGAGAWQNDRRLRVAARKKPGEAVVATGIPYMGRPGHDRFVKELDAIAPSVAGIRRFGSAALDLAYVAAGRFDAFWERGLNAWDVAGGAVLVEEAGGKVTHPDGPADDWLNTGDVLAGNLSLTPKLQGLIKEAA